MGERDRRGPRSPTPTTKARADSRFADDLGFGEAAHPPQLERTGPIRLKGELQDIDEALKEVLPELTTSSSSPVLALDEPTAVAKAKHRGLTQTQRSEALQASDLFEDLDAPLDAVLPHSFASSDTSDLNAPLDAPLDDRASSFDASAVVEVELPASILVVDSDLERAAHTAVKLLAFGYTCRITSCEDGPAVLREQRFDAVYVELDGDESKTAATSWRGKPVYSGLRGKMKDLEGTFLQRPWVSRDLVQAVEASRAHSRKLKLRSPASEPSRPTSGVAPRSSSQRPLSRGPTSRIERERSNPGEEVDLSNKVVRARLPTEAGGYSAGRIRAASYGGALTIEPARPAVAAETWTAALVLKDGRSQKFPVRHRGKGQWRVQVNGSDVPFFHAWLDEAQHGENPSTPVLLSRTQSEVVETPSEVETLWLTAREALTDDAAQQAFIQACVREQKLELAITRYRALKEEGIVGAEKYLTQVGTILGFYALRQTGPADGQTAGLSKQVKVVLGLFLLAALILVALANFAR